ncbi:hypothetical protein WM40_23685 [Robbsia andropogonis]|uniref:IPT/TIG domain-containing protein n=1 Tax=Robbsia andropogonis TaxID=28092 RepID=A0A0F5JUP4_9BURK|nr:hypothetical protein [Robbsia andropogonis]KKB61369.1 hypothetical protein WM40_23685 [Robbsia andropogonis]MCP1120871.1 hypothetical protein [Robbsia andropogonis]MCP1130667.1 hypothetical protein [Robbsia andropogonis]
MSGRNPFVTFLQAAMPCLFVCWSGTVFSADSNGAAMSFWTSQPVQPNETVVVSGGNIGPAATARLTRINDTAVAGPLDGSSNANSGWVDITPTQATENSLKFQLPNGARGVYAYQIVNSSESATTTHCECSRLEVGGRPRNQCDIEP